jgi:sugar/nucleoside kinase (ribokinase family)
VAPLVVVGNLARDLIDGSPPRTGGGPYHCARALRLLELPGSSVVTRCGDLGLVPALVALGIPVQRLPGTSTATFRFHYEADRRVMTVDELGDVWSPEDASALPRGGWVHVAPLARSDFGPETLAALARGRKVSFDGQGLVRPARTGPLVLDADYDPELLRYVSSLKLSDEEAAVLGEPASLGVDEVVVTHGSRGATVYAHGEVVEVSATPLDVDPTGAGDAFSIAYVAARAGGQTPASAARLATSVVARVLTDGQEQP